MILINLSHSFVLLTANMEDIKKLVRKFVSESLTEQIADFIAKVSSNTLPNLSEENEKNAAMFQQISGEENYRNNKIPKSRVSKMVRPMIPTTTRHADKKSMHYENPIRTTRAHKNRVFNLKNQPDFNPNDFIANMNFDNTDKRAESTTTTTAKPAESKIAIETFETINEPKKKRHKKRKSSSSKTASTFTFPFNLEANYDNIDAAVQRFGSLSSKEANASDGVKVVTTTMRYHGFNIERNGPEMTTKKERNEFDQYGFPNLPKAEFVATSGPLSLPKVRSRTEWWDGKQPEVDTNNKSISKTPARSAKKVWF